MPLVLFLLVSLTLAFPQEADVLVLYDHSFDQAVKEHPYLLVDFYAPWCGHCQKLAPEYAKAASILKTSSQPLYIAKVDATVSTGLAGRFDITSFPTLKFFQNGKARDYDGERTAEGIAAWVSEAAKPRVKVVNTAEKLKSSIEELGIAVVLFAKEGSEEALITELTASMKKADNFILVPSAEVAKAYSLSQPALLSFNHKEDTNVQFSDEWTSAKIADFVKKSSSQLVMTDSQVALEFAIQKRKPVMFVFRNETDIPGIFDLLMDVSQAENQEIRFCYDSLTNETMLSLVNFFGLSAESKPLALLFDMKGSTTRKYKYTESKLSKDGLTTFFTKWHKGLLTPFYKSEKDPEQSGPVLRMTSDNYDQMVSKYSSKGLLVFYYTDWCVRCQDIDLGHILHDLEDDKVRVGKIDVMKNELPWMDMPEYPAVYCYRSKKPFIFKGDFNTEDIIEWAKETCVKEESKKEKKGKKSEL